MRKVSRQEIRNLIKEFVNQKNNTVYDFSRGSGEPPGPIDFDRKGGGNNENHYYRRLFEWTKNQEFDSFELSKYNYTLTKDYNPIDGDFQTPEYFRVTVDISTSIMQPHLGLKFSFLSFDDEGELEVGEQYLPLFGFVIESEKILNDAKDIIKRIDDYYSGGVSIIDLYREYENRMFTNNPFNGLEHALTQK